MKIRLKTDEIYTIKSLTDTLKAENTISKDYSIKDSAEKTISMQKDQKITKGETIIRHKVKLKENTREKYDINMDVCDSKNNCKTITFDPDVTGCFVANASTTYTMTADINNSGVSWCINISKGNVTLDCNGYRVQGNNVADYGIYTSTGTNITIRNCSLQNWDTNAYAFGGYNVTLIDSEAKNNPDNGAYSSLLIR